MSVELMSHDEDTALLKRLQGSSCTGIVACNSLKIIFGDKSNFIWIDPPWVLAEPGQLISSSDEYLSEEPEFSSWCKKLDLANESVFLDYRYSLGVLLLQFSNNKIIMVPDCIDTDDPEEYENWYVTTSPV